MNKFLLFIIIVLLIVNSCILVCFQRYKKSSTSYIGILQYEASEITALKINANAVVENCDMQLSCINNNSLKQELVFQKWFKKGQKKLLVCRFSEMYCSSCVDYAIKNVLQWSDSIGMENLLFLGTYKNNKIFEKHKTLYGIEKFEVENIDVVNLPIEDTGFPYYFILDDEFNVLNVHIPEKSAPNIDYNYLRKIRERFF